MRSWEFVDLELAGLTAAAPQSFPKRIVHAIARAFNAIGKHILPVCHFSLVLFFLPFFSLKPAI